MVIEKRVFYSSSLEETTTIGNLTKEQTLSFLGNGRQCGVLLELQISNLFEDLQTASTQGDNADLVSDVHGSIQAKTFHSLEKKTITRGKNKGKTNHSQKNVFITKSCLWDSKKKREALGEDVDKTTEDYISSYDAFLMIDISQMKKDLSFSWILIDSEYIKEHHHKGFISLDVINNYQKKKTRRT